MNVQVFIQDEAGSNQKHYHDEKTLERKRVTTDLPPVAEAANIPGNP